MPTKYESSTGNYFKLPNPGLRAYFGHVRQGNPREYRTKFYDGLSLNEVVKLWSKHLGPLSKEWPTLLDYELDQAKKVGPMSVMKPLVERMEDIESYYSDIHLPSEPITHSAIAAVLSEWKASPPLRIRSQRRTVELMKKSTNSGSPFFTKRRNVIEATFPCELALNTPNVVQMLPEGNNYLSCAALGWRGQEGGPGLQDTKQRVVWMFPFAVNACELQLYQPLIESAQRYNLVPAWVSMESVDKEITALFDTKDPKDLIVCTDFTKFDQHFNASCQEAAREIIQSIFRTSPDIGAWIHDVFPIKYMIPLMYDEGKLKFGDHGMGSGSGGTNADETLVHRALQYECAQKARTKLNPHSQCLGDDGILSYPGIQVDDVVRSYSSHGLEMNQSKQSASDSECIYLRRWHHREYRHDGICVGVYPTMRALGRLAEQERLFSRDVWSPELEALRQLSIMENVKWHPLREVFVDFALKGMKYKMGLNIPGFFDKLQQHVKDAMAMEEDIIGYNRSQQESGLAGINDWWIVKYLRSKDKAI